MATTCPSPEQLVGFGMGAGSCPSGIAAHIDQCRECQEFLAQRVQVGLETLTPHAATSSESETIPRISGFTIERELGRGAMGVVYFARRDTLSRPVALKLLPGGRRASKRERRQWLREAEAASLVRHSNVVTLYEVGEADDCFLLVLEYIAGGTLADRLSGPLAPMNAARLMETIAHAVHHIHLHGLLHLDLKPSNILLDGNAGPDWEAIVPKVSDFGIARTAEPSATDTDGLGAGGSPPYMAPEQVVRPRKEMSPSADIHALGAILYHMLTGMPPYRGATVLHSLEQLRSQEPVPPRRLVPQIPRDLETIALKCLDKNPSSRYATAEAMADDLRCWLDGRPISARPLSPIENVWRRCRRQPVVAALTAILLLVVSIGFVTVVSLWQRAEAESIRAMTGNHFANQLFSEISAFSGPAAGQLSVVNRDDAIRIFERSRNQVLVQRLQRPEDLMTLRNLSNVDIALARKYAAEKKIDQARALLVECLESLNSIERRNPQDLILPCHRFAANYLFAEIAEIAGRKEQALAHIKWAVAYGENCLVSAPGHELVAEVAYCRWWLAESLSGQGDGIGAASAIVANLRMLEDVRNDLGSPIITIWRTLARVDLHGFKAPMSSTPTIPPNTATPFSRLASSEADLLDAEGWAELVAGCLSSGPAPVIPPDRHLCYFVDHLSARIARQRRSGRIDEARRSADRVHAFARLMVSRYPVQPVAHLAMCQAFKQIAKNASKIDDLAAVERNSRLAIEQARRALVLDPQDARAGSEVADLQRRLDELLLAKAPESDQNATAHATGETGQ